MKIAVISNHAPALENFRGPLLAEMVKRGHKVLAFAPNHDEQTRAAMQALGVQPVDYPLARTGLNPFKDMNTIIQLSWLLKMHRPDICFASAIKPIVYGMIAAWLAGAPRRYAMVEGLGFAFTSNDQGGGRPLVRWIATRLYQGALSLAHGVVFLNPDDRDEFVAEGLVSERRAVVLGGIGLDLEAWSYSPHRPGQLSFLMVARILKDKGVEDYVAAARLLKAQAPSVRFILLGDTDDNPAAIPLSEVRSWVEAGWIEWPGHAPVRPWFEQASVFVLPSYREGVPRSTQEAMALGLPIVTTDVPGCRETVCEGVNGFMVPPREPAALAAAMRYFIDHPEYVVPMGRSSRKMAEEKFDVHVQNGKLLAYMEIGTV